MHFSLRNPNYFLVPLNSDYAKLTVVVFLTQFFAKIVLGSSTTAVIEDLDAEKTYFFKLIATTKAGSGPPTPPLRISALCTGRMCVAKPADELPKEANRSVGIGIGVGIALTAVVICVLIIVIKHRSVLLDG